MDDQRVDRTIGRLRPLTPRERRFSFQILAIGFFVFVLSWFGMVSKPVGRIALVVGIFGGRIARGFDGQLDQSTNETSDEK
jgi:hypothetical protein